jgi:hypothetical protein
MGPFKDDIQSEEIFPGVFLIKNFLSEQECDFILETMSEPKEINEYNPKKIFAIDRSTLIIDRLKEYVLDDLYVYESFTGTVLKKGGNHPIHLDNPYGYLDRDAHNSINPGEPVYKYKSHAWGTVVYLSNFEGGEIFYPNYMEYYSPKKGNLIVHTSEIDMPHGVLNAKDNNRFIHTTFFYRGLTVPVKYMEEGLAKESDIMQSKYGWPKWSIDEAILKD